MFSSTTLLGRGANYYPLGNTPPVSLTQDLPPEQDADILLLGCGDVRNILFTCFADAARKMDVTCCDIEPGIHARNVLLYTLLIEDKENLNIKRIWNIYYHLKLDKESVECLETQLQKLLEVSKSLDQWHGSVYGSSIRFCDEKSLSLVRSYWHGYRLRGLSCLERAQRLIQLQAALDRAKAFRREVIGDDSASSVICSTYPVLNAEAMKDVKKVAQQWWDCGTTSSSGASGRKATELNPGFLYSPNQALTLNYGFSPIAGFPLSVAYTPITKGSALYHERNRASSTEYLVDSAKNHFTQWASAFRKAVENKSVIRIFCGDALAFCWILRNFQLSMPASSTALNLCSGNWSNSPLKLHHGDYKYEKNGAPLSFDVIDTSNLIDHLGPLNVISICSSLLKYNTSSSLYTETLFQYDSLSDIFNVDARTISLLLGIFLPDLFTNAVNRFEDDITMYRMAGLGMTQIRSRSRLLWRRLRGCHESQNSPYLCVEAKSLAKLLIQVHDAMFKYDDEGWILESIKLNKSVQFPKHGSLCYNRASFALFLHFLKTIIISDWEQCFKHIYSSRCCLNIKTPFLNSAEDLLLQMHLYGVDNHIFSKPSSSDMNGAILTPMLPLRANEKVPDQLCVTIRVSREKFKHFTRLDCDKIGVLAFVCTFEGGDPGSRPWVHTFSAIQITYGTWHEQSNEEYSNPYIDEDNFQLFGMSDMFVSVYVPTMMLLQSKFNVPMVKCELSRTTKNLVRFFRLVVDSQDICFSRCKMTSQDVKITRYMPGMSGLPQFPHVSTIQNKPTSATTLLLTNDSSKVDKLVRRISLESQEAKTELANPSSKVKIEFKSPFAAFITISRSHELQFEFPVPVSPSKYKVRIARKSSYIEVESPFFDPLEEDASSFLFPFFITKTPSNVTVPTTWTSTRIDLAVMPQIDLKDTQPILWLITHASLMFSEREGHIRESSSRKRVDVRTDLKDKLFSILMHYTNLRPPHGDIFALHKTGGEFQTLIFPSCLRLDLVSHTVVLDTAIIPLTSTMLEDPRAVRFLEELSADDGLIRLEVSEDENRAWKAMMPSLVERCRTAKTWKHSPSCEYIQTGEVSFSVSPICSCGIGKFPSGYLEGQKRLSHLSYMINRYATRAAVAPIFMFVFVEHCSLKIFSNKVRCFEDTCAYCNRSRWTNGLLGAKGFMRCSKCTLAFYCSKKCQKADWATHKVLCSITILL